MQEVFQTRKPNSSELQKHIAYYYFHQSGGENKTQSFIYYPHFKNALSIYKNSEVILENKYSTIAKPANCGYSFGFSKLTNHAAKAEIIPPFNKIGIAFQALGLNHFLPNHLSEYLPEPINFKFDFFRESMEGCLDKVYQTDSIEEKVRLLDEYFLSVFIGFSEQKICDAVELLMNNDLKYTVGELAEELEVSRKTLLRLFRKHLNCSAIDYIKLIQFRKSVDIFQNSETRASLTDLAHHTEYYDQSDFINHFKKLTGFNPKSFFRSLSNLGNQDTYWTFD